MIVPSEYYGIPFLDFRPLPAFERSATLHLLPHAEGPICLLDPGIPVSLIACSQIYSPSMPSQVAADHNRFHGPRLMEDSADAVKQWTIDYSDLRCLI
jgi:hypothetical protein